MKKTVAVGVCVCACTKCVMYIIFVNLIHVNLVHTAQCERICIIIAWYYHKRDDTLQKWMDSLISDGRYNDLLSGIRITSNTTLVVEVIVRAVRIILWTQNSRYPAGTSLGVWLPNLQLLFTSIFINIILNIIMFALKLGRSRSNAGLHTFFTLFWTAFILLYFFFPTMILTFVYPTRMIVIFAFAIDYLFVTFIFSASVVKLYKHNKAANRLLPFLPVCYIGAKSATERHTESND